MRPARRLVTPSLVTNSRRLSPTRQTRAALCLYTTSSEHGTRQSVLKIQGVQVRAVASGTSTVCSLAVNIEHQAAPRSTTCLSSGQSHRLHSKRGAPPSQTGQTRRSSCPERRAGWALPQNWKPRPSERRPRVRCVPLPLPARGVRCSQLTALGGTRAVQAAECAPLSSQALLNVLSSWFSKKFMSGWYDVPQ